MIQAPSNRTVGGRLTFRSMAATPFIDLNSIDLNRVLVAREQIYERLPHRFEFSQLDAILHMDKSTGISVARRDVRSDEFWVRGHIPGRPLLPGVLMIETAAQMAAYMAMELTSEHRFIGFARVDDVVFRGTVSPPATMYFIMKMVEIRSRRVVGDAQALLNGQLVFEGRITGMPF